MRWLFTKNKLRGKSDYSGETIDLIKQYNTELEHAKAKAKESDRLKTAFLTNLSHEIRTPMNGILGFANLLRIDGLSKQNQDDYIDLLKKSGERMLRLIDNLIDISMIESGQLEIRCRKTNLNTLIDNTYAFFKPQADAKGIELQYKKEFLNSEAGVMVDATRLEQVLSNLIRNSLEFTYSGVIYFGYKRDNESLWFWVKDTGIGIQADMIDLIFDRFGRADNKMLKSEGGCGLGLAISKGIIEKMGGEIWVETEVGTGSTFNFKIPFRREKNIEKIKESEKMKVFPIQ